MGYSPRAGPKRRPSCHVAQDTVSRWIRVGVGLLPGLHFRDE